MDKERGHGSQVCERVSRTTVVNHCVHVGIRFDVFVLHCFLTQRPKNFVWEWHTVFAWQPDSGRSAARKEQASDDVVFDRYRKRAMNMRR